MSSESAAKTKKAKKMKMPHIYVLLISITIICAAASWFLPAGEFERALSDAGREMVVPGTYHVIESTPVGFFTLVQSIYNGTVDAAGVIFFVFISYASIGLIIASGAFNGLVASMLRILKGSARAIIIPVFITLIGCASSTIGVFEEMFPFIPIFVGIAIAMGYDAIVALGTGLGYSGAVMNPFTVGMAQSIADVPQMSGAGYRIICHIILIAVASFFVIRYALKIQADPTKSLVNGDDFSSLAMDSDHIENKPFGIREKLVLATLVAGIVVIVWGTKAKGWYFAELSAVFLLMGLVSGFIMGWGPNEIAEKVAKSFSEIAVACMMIGIARGILVVLQAGHIIDTIVYYLSIPLSQLPGAISAVAMFLVQTGINFFIPSGSGQAVTSMPIMAPLADLIGISRQSAVLAFQFGDGLSNIIWPTSMTPIICGIAGVKIEKWWKWFVPVFIVLVLTQSILMAVSVVIW
ncbi:TIGR00366 family protein [[Clostridium] symbiosum]|uniref:YfcC family protein n=1 Tax=Clostridium symbiosum TaxID=1512 RepID=UPI0006C3FDBE|nr:TIGR00366 family protein [[Clostridium] symbiosum]MDB2020560.1 TIGR00366 family protein [[Clostridium] symbiosum]CUP19382.1 C4-dicarboxylate anaerobic carrier [[Clostridium] symbiosum]